VRRQLVETAQRTSRHTRTLMAPAEAMNVLTVVAVSEDLTPPRTAPATGSVTLHAAGETLPALSSAIGLGAFRSIKPDFITTAGEHEFGLSATRGGVRLRVIKQTQRTGLHVATVQRGAATTYRTRGTSCATALASRAALFSLAGLTAHDGPYAEEVLSARDRALLTKALSVNAARWPKTAIELFAKECAPEPRRHARSREEVCRYYGHGVLDPVRMREAPPWGATLVGLGSVRKDKAALFEVPLPASLAGERVGRSMCVNIAWFSPVRASRARYRLALLEAVAHGYAASGDSTVDDGWALALKSDQLDANIIKRGTVWSQVGTPALWTAGRRNLLLHNRPRKHCALPTPGATFRVGLASRRQVNGQPRQRPSDADMCQE
jgi:hypothetical protein